MLVSTSGNDQHEAQFGPLPFVIGVTGHRDLRPADLTELEERVRSFFKQIRKKYPHTPLTLLSPLAEGADRLVARVALELGSRLIVPLPMRRELYERDFSTAASRAEFRELLESAQHCFVLPRTGGYREAEIEKDGEARDYQYEQVGAYIARHSQILLALWDGVYTNLVGGTSAVVRFQLKGVPEPYAPPRTELDFAESGEVYHIATPRTKNPKPKIKAFTVRKLSPAVDQGDEHEQVSCSNDILPDKKDDRIGRMYERIYERIENFNRDALEQSPRLASQLEESKNRLFPDEEIEGLPNTFNSIRERYAMADTLAIYFQGRMKKTLNGLFVLAFVAAILFGVYAHFEFAQHRLQASILLLYVFITITAYYLLYLPTRRKDYQNRYQDYRALAEGMRVQFFWCLADLKLSVADHYLRKQRSELDWVCSAVHVWNLPEAANGDMKPAAEPDRTKHIAQVRKHWVTDQLNYFKESAEKDLEELEGYEPWVKRLFWAGVVLALLLAMALLLPHPWQNRLARWLKEYPNIRGVLIILMSTPLVAAALLHNYAEKRALSEHSKQYNRMAQLFATAEQRLREMIEKGDYKRAQRLIEELGKEALAENGDWVLLHRERPLEVPHPG